MLAAGSALAAAMSPRTLLAQTPVFQSQAVQGAVLPTRGTVTGTVLPLNGPAALLFVTRNEWNDLATQWAKKHAPAAKVVSFGKHMMFLGAS
ncbi:hypothetical protein ACVIKP_000005 [Rhizobium leguminosarum]